MSKLPSPTAAQRRLLEQFARLELDEDRRTPLNRAIAAILAYVNRLEAERRESQQPAKRKAP